MNSNAQVLLDAVLALPVPDRAELAQAVLESLNSSECEVSDDELDRELARRAGDLRANLSSSIPWSEVQKLR